MPIQQGKKKKNPKEAALLMSEEKSFWRCSRAPRRNTMFGLE